MFTYFISDLHLDENCKEPCDLFIKFLNEKFLDNENANLADAIYILGDFWEKWLGDDCNSKFISEIKSLLKQVSTKTKLFFMLGNRDFLVGKKFQKDVNCTILPDPCIIKLYGEKILLSHGDILCTNDIKNLILQKAIRNPLSQFIFTNLPMGIRTQIANFLRKQSSSHKNNTINSECRASFNSEIPLKPKNNELLKSVESQKYDVNLNCVKKLMLQHKAYTLIHGHTHKPNIHNFMVNNKNAKRISLGSWENSAYILKYTPSHSSTLELIS